VDLLYNISICCGFVVDLLYNLLYNKLNRWSLGFMGQSSVTFHVLTHSLLSGSSPVRQWRSKALRGPGSTVTWGPPFPSPPLPPPSPFPLPFPAQPLPMPRSCPQIQLWGLGSAVSSPQRDLWRPEPQPKSNWVHFSLKIRHLVATILMIFLRVLPKMFPHYSGSQELGGPGSLNRLNSGPVPTPLLFGYWFVHAGFVFVPISNMQCL